MFSLLRSVDVQQWVGIFHSLKTVSECSGVHGAVCRIRLFPGLLWVQVSQSLRLCFLTQWYNTHHHNYSDHRGHHTQSTGIGEMGHAFRD